MTKSKTTKAAKKNTKTSAKKPPAKKPAPTPEPTPTRKERSERMADKMLKLSAGVSKLQDGLNGNKRWQKALEVAKSAEAAKELEKELSEAVAALVRASATMRKLEYVFRRNHKFSQGDTVTVGPDHLARYVDGDIITEDMMQALSVLKVKGRNVFVETATNDGAPVRLLVPRTQLLPA